MSDEIPTTDKNSTTGESSTGGEGSQTEEAAKTEAPPPRRRRRVVDLVILLVLVGAAVGWVFHYDARREKQLMGCLANLSQIQAAFMEYHTQYGTFPPAYIADADGNRLHSWRVLILPQLGEETLWLDYNFDEPWNGPNNRKLAERMPAVYRCPNAPAGQEVSRTNYVVVTGPGTAFPGREATTIGAISDGLANTILVTELFESDVFWTEPRDASIEQVGFGPGAWCRSRLRGDPDGPGVIFGDGAVAWRLSPWMDRQTLEGLLSAAGGEPIDRQQLHQQGLITPP